MPVFFLATTQMDLNELVKHSGGVNTQTYVISTSYLAKKSDYETKVVSS